MNEAILLKLLSRKFIICMVAVLTGIFLCCFRYITDGIMMVSIGTCSYVASELVIDIFRIVFKSRLFTKEDDAK